MDRSERNRIEEETIMAMMEEVERDACRIFPPDAEFFGPSPVKRRVDLYTPFPNLPRQTYRIHAGRRTKRKKGSYGD